MKKLILGILSISSILFISCKNDDDNNNETMYEEIVAVANRGSASVSLINANTNQVESTIAIANSEPMYVVYVESKDRLYVGDRATNKVHIINPKTKSVESDIAVGNGVFHMWADGQGKQLWVNNDVDNTISVIDLSSNSVVKTIDVGMKPHDVFLTQNGTTAYVSVINTDATMPDKIYMYSTSSYEKTGESSVGKDPHLFHLTSNDKLYVPCQSGELYTLNGSNLDLISNNAFEGAHGVYASPDQNNIFMTNISGGQLYSINAQNSTINGSSINSLAAIPHNVVVNKMGNKLFVTHSGGSANTVSTYSINNSTLDPESSITIGTNPFGLTYYKRKLN